MRQSRSRDGFTLVEVLVVLGIISLLLGICLPAIQAARNAADRHGCRHRLSQIGRAMHQFHDTQCHFPPQSFPNDSTGLAKLSWMVFLLPFVEQENLWKATQQACKEDPTEIKDPPHIGRTTPVSMFLCPADSRLSQPLITPTGDRVAFCSFVGIRGVGRIVENYPETSNYRPGVFHNDGGQKISEILDGTSHTLMIGERPPPKSLQAGKWYCRSCPITEPFGGADQILNIPQIPSVKSTKDPCLNYGDVETTSLGPGRLENSCDRNHFWSLHGGGAHFLAVDGSVHFLPYSFSPLLPALVSIAGGEIAPNFDD